MDDCWQSYDAWIAYFDLLGFEEKLKELPISILQQKMNEIVKDLQAEKKEFKENIDCHFYSDTFIFYSKSDENKDYPGLLHVATHFMEKCISKGIALRGAISYGEIAVRDDKTIIIGSAFLDGHKYGEDQNWLGLILTPTASKRLKEAKLDPINHGFIYGELPQRQCPKVTGKVHAYSFCRGKSNFPSPLLPKLKEMQLLSPETTKLKYENTIGFIEKHWKWLSVDLST